MNVRDIMTKTVLTVAPQTTVTDVIRLMLDSGVSGLPVVDEPGHLAGLITEKDLVAKHARAHVPTYLGIMGFVLPIELHNNDEEVRRVLAVTARELMTEHVVTVGPNESVDDLATLMVDRNVNPVPVLEENRLIGIVSRHDVLRLLLLEDQGTDESASES